MRGGSEPDVTLWSCGSDHAERARVIDTDASCSLAYKNWVSFDICFLPSLGEFCVLNWSHPANSERYRHCSCVTLHKINATLCVSDLLLLQYVMSNLSRVHTLRPHHSFERLTSATAIDRSSLGTTKEASAGCDASGNGNISQSLGMTTGAGVIFYLKSFL